MEKIINRTVIKDGKIMGHAVIKDGKRGQYYIGIENRRCEEDDNIIIKVSKSKEKD